jgi:hypothetical protein
MWRFLDVERNVDVDELTAPFVVGCSAAPQSVSKCEDVTAAQAASPSSGSCLRRAVAGWRLVC